MKPSDSKSTRYEVIQQRANSANINNAFVQALYILTTDISLITCNSWRATKCFFKTYCRCSSTRFSYKFLRKLLKYA